MAYETFSGEPSECELYARYAYHLIAKDYRAHPADYRPPQQGIYLLRQRIRAIDDWMLDLFLLAYQYLAARGVDMKFARTAMIERARKGLDFRSVVFIDYKAQRRHSPPVSNTGGVPRNGEEV